MNGLCLYALVVLISLSMSMTQYHCPCNDYEPWHGLDSPNSLNSPDSAKQIEYPTLNNSRSPLIMCLDLSSLSSSKLAVVRKVVDFSSSIDRSESVTFNRDFRLKEWLGSSHNNFQNMSLDQLERLRLSCTVFVALTEHSNHTSPSYHRGSHGKSSHINHSNKKNFMDGNARTVCPGICSPVPSRSIYLDQILSHHDNDASIRTARHHAHNNMNEQHSRGHNLRREHHPHPSLPTRSGDALVTCSMTTDMLTTLADIIPETIDHRQKTLYRFKLVLWRIIMECFERKHWYSRYDWNFRFYGSSTPDIPRRKVESVCVWVGVISNIHQIEEQAIVLDGYPSHGTKAVVGWAATDDVFACTAEETVCRQISKRGSSFIPRSNINGYNVGWRCAQRRPLRALAHVLSLFDPNFLIIGDDDTFVNYPLLIDRYHDVLYKDMHIYPIVLGELTGAEGPSGHLTLKGFYGGGSGYILGKRLIESLTRMEVNYWDQADNPHSIQRGQGLGDSFKSHQQVLGLSLVAEGLAKLKYCSQRGHSDHKKCVDMNPMPRKYELDGVLRDHNDSFVSKYLPWNVTANTVVVSIGSRLIDVCVNMMANENTCLHR